jgi:hypothetical protein
MKINFEDYDFTDFMVKEGAFCGEWSKLITPNHIGTKFNQRNKIFRSSIWSMDGQLLSAGLPKFVNFSENPDNFPVPLSTNNCSFVDKIDGSLTCIDYFNKQISMRTRGTFSINTMENKVDFELCLSKYPKIAEWLMDNSHYTLLFEITTPNMKIVLDYGTEPDFWLVGAVNKNDYSLMTQPDLDKLGVILGVKRPASFSFNSIDELLNVVSKWVGREGICLYSKNGQEIHKIKAEVYLKLHRFKENATLENTLELFVEYGCPPYQDFENKLQTQFDYECWNMIRGYASQVCDAYKEVLKIIAHMKEFTDPLKALPRKDAAMKIISSYGGESNNRAAFCFKLLDGKTLQSDDIKKLLFQCLKNKI